MSAGPPDLVGAALGAGTDGFDARAGTLAGGLWLSGWKEYRVDHVAAIAISTAHTSAVAHRARDENLCVIAASTPRGGVTEAVARTGSDSVSNCSLKAAANARHRSNLSSGFLASAVKNTSSRCANSGR